ncbi:hypothetical protein E2C01_047324 [Portunus trituberculatus]|uniref:Uncharacterized protein n=1 Tax=Portunus trituberculatus TaxID=210409 RepID=A0A5B7GA68_PORTR|nr:hypothetical protein [Portunus trituberculatus]
MAGTTISKTEKTRIITLKQAGVKINEIFARVGCHMATILCVLATSMQMRCLSEDSVPQPKLCIEAVIDVRGNHIKPTTCSVDGFLHLLYFLDLCSEDVWMARTNEGVEMVEEDEGDGKDIEGKIVKILQPRGKLRDIYPILSTNSLLTLGTGISVGLFIQCFLLHLASFSSCIKKYK